MELLRRSDQKSRPAKHTLSLALLCGTVLGAQAQITDPSTVTSESHSGQFIIHAPASSDSAAVDRQLATNHGFVRLDPMLLTVSCERIKQHLWRGLGNKAPWTGRIYLDLYPGTGADQPIGITPNLTGQGWRYRVDLPEVVERPRFLQAMVQVLLLELANRQSGTRLAEIPVWLVEGFSQELLTSSEAEIILPPPTKTVNGIRVISATVTNRPRAAPLEQAHRLLQTRAPLTFEQLSWPADDQLIGDAGDIYRCCAQLFVQSLLRLEDGPACLRAMLAELPHYYNWQLAFLKGFHGHFERPLDIEKWWALQLVHFTGRDVTQTWTPAESWRKLDQTLRWAVQAGADTNALPLRAETTLQSIIREWDRASQPQVLKAKLQELDLLRLRIAPEMIGMVDDYRRVVETYVQELPKPRFSPFSKRLGPGRAAEQAIKALDELDARREALRPEPAPLSHSPTHPLPHSQLTLSA